ncbi:hypothetical protein K1719_002742 [Acacia pycnantha]|nr:hypothetical protein K1719_002742 [Acacia pycnantha]
MSESETKRETWTQEMDDALVDAFLHQQNDGNRVSGTFTSKAYDTIIKELQEKFGRPFEKEKVKSRWKLVKKHTLWLAISSSTSATSSSSGSKKKITIEASPDVAESTSLEITDQMASPGVGVDQDREIAGSKLRRFREKQHHCG